MGYQDQADQDARSGADEEERDTRMRWRELRTTEEAWIKARADLLLARDAYEQARVLVGLPVCRSWNHQGDYDDTCPSCEKPTPKEVP